MAVEPCPQLEQPQDRLPPQDLQAEQATLGAMLIDPEAVSRALAVVSEGEFYREAHREICSAIRAVQEAGDPVDLVTAGAELRRRGKLAQVGGSEYLTALIGEVPTSAHTIRYATIVHEKAVLRRVIAAGSDIQTLGYSDPDELRGALVRAQEIVHTVLDADRGGGGAQALLEHEAADLAWLREQMAAPATPYGMRTGISRVDRATGGLGEQRLILVAADTKLGKSALCQQAVLVSALDSARAGCDAGVFLVYALESGARNWYRRAMAWLSGVPNDVLRRGGRKPTAEEIDRVEQAQGRWRQAARHIRLSDNLSDLGEIEADVRAMLARPDVEVRGVVIDYAQLLEVAEVFELTPAMTKAGERLQKLAEAIGGPILLPTQVTDGRPMYARALMHNASMTLVIDRGDDGDDLADRQRSPRARITGTSTRDTAPFGPVEVSFHGPTYHFTDASEAAR